MGKKTFNNFGASRVTSTVSPNLDDIVSYSGLISSTANLALSMTLLGGLDSLTRYVRRRDKNFSHRMREYVNTCLNPANTEKASSNPFSNTNVKGAYMLGKVNVNNPLVKQLVGVSPSATIDTSSEVWKTYAGKALIGFPAHNFLTYYPAYQSGASLPYNSDNFANVIKDGNAAAIRNFTCNGAATSAVAAYERTLTVSRPDYTPFSFCHNNDAMGNQTWNSNFMHPLGDFLSGCTVSQKKTVTDLISDFRELFFAEVFSYCTNPVLASDLGKVRDAIMVEVSNGNKMPFINLSNLPLENINAVLAWCDWTNHQATLGSTLTGGATGLIHYEGHYVSGVAGYETIERLMSGATISIAYTDVSPASTPRFSGSATFSKQGRVGALRSLQLIFPDNILRKKYELGLTPTKPTGLYSGLISTRPLGKFTTVSASDGCGCEVRVKDTQLSLVAFGLSRYAIANHSVGTLTWNINGVSSQQGIVAGCFNYNNQVKVSYTKLNSVDFTLDGSTCRIFGFGDAIRLSDNNYATTSETAFLTAVGGIDPTQGTQQMPTNIVLRAFTDSHPIRLCVLVPRNVDDMKVDDFGKVPYFELAGGSLGVHGLWTCKASFGYIQGSYQVFTRLTTYGNMKAIHGAGKTFEECVDLGTTAFINECRNYFDVADTDPSPVEQLMAYTPLNSVGFDLPPIKSYVKPFYDYGDYPQDETLWATPSRDVVKKALRIDGAFSGGRGTRIDSLAKHYYGSKLSSSNLHIAGWITGVKYNLRWLVTGEPPQNMDSMLGYYHTGERDQVKAKWDSGSLFRIRDANQPEADFTKGGRVGFRAVSMSSGVLLMSGNAKYGSDAILGNGSSMSRPFGFPIYGSVSAGRPYGVQSDVSPELLDVALRTTEVGSSPEKVALNLGLYRFNPNTSNIYKMPEKGTHFDYITNATRVLSGVACSNDVPTKWIPVRLYDRDSGELLAYQLSQEGGKYRFKGVQPHRTYTVVAIDPTKTYNSDIEDVEVKLT